MTTNRYAHQRYLLMTLDPVHPGAGGYRLGRVDNSIAREPGTRLPKIPGSSLHGAARAYAAMRHEKPQCAGQGGHCGRPDCPICYTFGYITGDKMYSGVVNLFDAQLLLFPVHSVAGPVWVSTQERLQEAGFEADGAPEKEDQVATTLVKHPERLNLGWLMLKVAEGQVKIKPPSDSDWENSDAWKAIAARIVLVSPCIFGAIVNSNLEVRTSVAINPETGAAEEGALYTYEAIPRAAFLTAEVVLDDYRQQFQQNGQNGPDPLAVVQAGLQMIEYLSVGGMGTRGFGRMKVIGRPLTQSLFSEAQP